jgi:hypothetical protein
MSAGEYVWIGALGGALTAMSAAKAEQLKAALTNRHSS